MNFKELKAEFRNKLTALRTILPIVFLLLAAPLFAQDWWGYDVKMTDWASLSVDKKTQFLSEVIPAIEADRSVSVDKVDPERFLSAVDTGVAFFLKQSPNTEIPMIKFVYDLLQEDERLHPIGAGSENVFPEIG